MKGNIFRRSTDGRRGHARGGVHGEKSDTNALGLHQTLRQWPPDFDGLPLDRRYKGVGLQKREQSSSHVGSTTCYPSPLAQQVLRLDGEVGIVTVALDPIAKCHSVHPERNAIVQKKPTGDGQDGTAQCEVRCIVRVEVYLPRSSKTLVLCTRVSSTSRVPNESRVVHSNESRQFVMEHECHLRKRQRGALREALLVEEKTRAKDMSGVLEKSISFSKLPSGSEARPQISGVDPDNRRVNNAFSVLLVRADLRVPVERIQLGSGSWKEAVGALVGCPSDVELRTVRTLWADSLSGNTIHCNSHRLSGNALPSCRPVTSSPCV